MTNNSKTKAKIATLNVPIPIPIELLYFLSKKGQYIVPNNIADQYAHVCLGLIMNVIADSSFLTTDSMVGFMMWNNPSFSSTM